jgi:phosphonate transport system substrate-binding protein
MRNAEMMIRTIAASAILGALLGGSAAAQEKPALVFTAIPDQDETRLVERFTRVADYLRGKLSVPVRYLTSCSKGW